LLHHVGDLFKLNVKLRCQNINTYSAVHMPQNLLSTGDGIPFISDII
jgi:hypothetical protein